MNTKKEKNIMDIKVRTKTKVSLIDCTHKNIGIYGKRPQGELNYVVASQGDKVEILGEYESEKRATEVLELIELSIEALISVLVIDSFEDACRLNKSLRLSQLPPS